MADYEDVRRRIISSVFSRRNASNNTDENYVAHLRIWEVEGGNDKLRYIILSDSTNGPMIHKSRLNTNGTFSVGKTWNMNELHAIEVSGPQEFTITFARSYRWHTERQNDQDRFVDQLIQLFRNHMGPDAPLRLVGVSRTPQPVRQPILSDRLRRDRSPTPTTDTSATVRRPQPTLNGRASRETVAQSQRTISPVPRNLNRTPANGNISDSPANAPRSRRASPARVRAPSPSTSQVGPSRPRHGRQLSNANTVSSVHSSGSAPGHVPSILIPPSSPIPAPVPAPAPNRSRSEETPIPRKASNGQELGARQTNETYGASLSTSNLHSSTPSPVSRAPPDDQMSSSKNLTPSRGPSPAPSSTSKRSQKSRFTPEPSMRMQPSTSQMSQSQRKDANARISFFDTANQALLDRLLSTTTSASSRSKEGDDKQESGSRDHEDDFMDEGDSITATLANIEEMLEGYEWAGDGLGGLGSSTRRGPVEHIESRLLDELMLLEKANIHSFLESDDRTAKVVQYLEEAIQELDNMETTVSSYKIHLNAVGDDIAYIQSQRRGLQVQTQNQKALLNELEKLLQTVHVDRETLISLTQESLEKTPSIQRLEVAASELYKALLAGRDSDMAATMERLEEYRTHNSQFCKRMLDFLSIMFTAQTSLLLKGGDGIDTRGDRPTILPHADLEGYLGRYCGLMLYLKEMDETKYSKVCAAYFSAASELHARQIKALLSQYSGMIKRVDEEPEHSGATSGLRRAGTVVRSPLESRKEKEKAPNGTMRPSEVLSYALEQIAPQVYREEEFIADFLQVNDAALTFADYLGLEHYFRRQASQLTGLSNATIKLLRGAMDLIFGFLPTELKSFIESALAKDTINIVGVILSVERAMVDAEERGNAFFARILDKQHQRLKSNFDRHVDEQIKLVEQTKLSAKKRRGVAPFIKNFPVYVNRVEAQLIGGDDMEIRGNVDAAYERIVQAMFDCLKQMAKMDGEQGEDKGQLNFHVILIENMQHFIAEVAQSNVNAVRVFRKRAEGIYDENLNAYVKIVLRRPFAKIIDYFEGVERLLKSTAPAEVSKNSAYNRSSLKRVVKDYNAKDIRKHVDALYKRVEKHFTDADAADANSGSVSGTVLASVWKACEEELMRITELFTKRISQCYSDSGVSLEYSAADVEAAFKRHQPST